MKSNSKAFIGIDPGARGGVAVIGVDGKVLELVEMPRIEMRFDVTAFSSRLKSIVSEFHVAMVGLEKVSPVRDQGVQSGFTFGQYFGEVKGVVIALNLRLRLITPQEWQRQMHLGTSYKLEPKCRSLESAKLLWPDTTFLASDRSRKPHDGLYEAALIGEYTRRVYHGLGGINEGPENVVEVSCHGA